jgi:hypothetical protein
MAIRKVFVNISVRNLHLRSVTTFRKSIEKGMCQAEAMRGYWNRATLNMEQDIKMFMVSQLVKEFPALMEPEGSLPYPQISPMLHMLSQLNPIHTYSL